ncbi:hypothetical protein FBQ96_14055 [Nitrospirales bacterium NOB]|nr:hypothetical protein [Nitrospirota bacterium]MCE7964654.1 hypothetical protein [Nitrospira sp. NTP2]MCK6493942.1 hypothetical protein [Nitrospira sp.]MDL1890673.1 hypothetical protein [Nitrospirales bacterium NOB]MEB2338249.1 hypothetical protein [Nitrospirales bacterium]
MNINDPIQLDAERLAAFRKEVTSHRAVDSHAWEASSRLVKPEEWPKTRESLCEAIERSTLSPDFKHHLLAALPEPDFTSHRSGQAETLKELTGLPRTKGLRALCLFFGLRSQQPLKWPVPLVTAAAVETFLRTQSNPYDILTEQVPASVLDLGAGDLSFAEELATLYGPQLSTAGRPLILHCVDRLDPASQLGGPLHAPPLRLSRLRSAPHLQFRFYGNQDMCALSALEEDGRLAQRYLIVSCWAPATPTFAYEPTRLAPAVIAEELRRTKGEARLVRHGKESALEVLHAGRNLLFPPWKFDIRGPLVLLQIMAMHGALCVLGSVDSQVFWELLAQLIDDPRVRPADVVFSDHNLPKIFGDTYTRLSTLPLGASCDLSEITPLRPVIPSVLPTATGSARPYRFRQVSIRRGALWSGMPASSTARQFQSMTEETPPWFLTLVPETLAAGI